jgi:hypothetical protein
MSSSGGDASGAPGDASSSTTAGGSGGDTTSARAGGAGESSAGSTAIGGSAGAGGGSAGAGTGGSSSGAGGSTAACTNDMMPSASGGPACQNVFVASAPMIDDMEIRPPENDGPHGDTDNGMPGHWFVATDGTKGTWIPPANKWNGFYNVTLDPPRDTSKQAMFFGGQGFTDWGVAIGVGIAACVDASAYSGITFWAKSTGSNALTAKLDVGTYDIVATTNGGGCTGSCTGKYETSVVIPTEWKEITIPFCSFARTGTTAPIAKNKIVNFTFLIAGKVDYQFYIDDLSFY